MASPLCPKVKGTEEKQHLSNSWLYSETSSAINRVVVKCNLADTWKSEKYVQVVELLQCHGRPINIQTAKS